MIFALDFLDHRLDLILIANIQVETLPLYYSFSFFLFLFLFSFKYLPFHCYTIPFIPLIHVNISSCDSGHSKAHLIHVIVSFSCGCLLHGLLIPFHPFLPPTLFADSWDRPQPVGNHKKTPPPFTLHDKLFKEFKRDGRT